MERGFRTLLPSPSEHPLTSRQLAMLKRMLDQQRAFRIDQLVELHTPHAVGPLGGGDPEIVRSLIAGARSALHDVQEALWRLEEGTYGNCVACGTPIPFERLEILPQTARCLPCQRPE